MSDLPSLHNNTLTAILHNAIEVMIMGPCYTDNPPAFDGDDAPATLSLNDVKQNIEAIKMISTDDDNWNIYNEAGKWVEMPGTPADIADIEWAEVADRLVTHLMAVAPHRWTTLNNPAPMDEDDDLDDIAADLAATAADLGLTPTPTLPF